MSFTLIAALHRAAANFSRAAGSARDRGEHRSLIAARDACNAALAEHRAELFNTRAVQIRLEAAGSPLAKVLFK